MKVFSWSRVSDDLHGSGGGVVVLLVVVHVLLHITQHHHHHIYTLTVTPIPQYSILMSYNYHCHNTTVTHVAPPPPPPPPTHYHTLPYISKACTQSLITGGGRGVQLQFISSITEDKVFVSLEITKTKDDVIFGERSALLHSQVNIYN